MTAILVSHFWIDLRAVILGSLHQDLLPCNVDTVLARQFVEHTVAPHDDEVVVVSNFKGCNVRVCNYHLGVAFVLLQFSLDIANRS